MLIKSYKPRTSSLRARKTLKNPHIWGGPPYKPLTKGLNKKAGRNNQGRITVQHRGGGTKKTYRCVNFHINPLNSYLVERIEYDPNRTCLIALIKDVSLSTYSYIIASEGLESGNLITPNSLTAPIKNFPIGSTLHNIETYPGSGGKLKRAAGTYATLLSLKNETALIALSIKKTLTISWLCQASLGKVSNPEHKNIRAGKAGASRWRGWKPVVKGTSMNPVDHPHGGKTKRGKLPKTPWGKLTRGKKTT